MAKPKRTKNKKAPNVRVYIQSNEAAALLFLKSFPDFADKTPQAILKTCLMIVAVDARTKLDAARRQHEEEEAKKRSASDTAGEPNDDSVRGTDAVDDNNEESSEIPGKAEEGKG